MRRMHPPAGPPSRRLSILPFAEIYTVIDLVSTDSEGGYSDMFYSVWWPRLPGDTSDVPPDSVREQVEHQFMGTVWDDLNIWRYQEYVEHPALSRVDAKPYMAMRKWATQFYEAPASV